MLKQFIVTVIVINYCISIANVLALDSSEIFYVSDGDVTEEATWTTKGGLDYLCCKQGGRALRIYTNETNSTLKDFIGNTTQKQWAMYIGAGLAPKRSKG